MRLQRTNFIVEKKQPSSVARLHGNGLINKTSRFEYWFALFLFLPVYAGTVFLL